MTPAPTIPVTGRTPEFLARQFGFAHFDDFIMSIPHGAVVLDIGAGASLLGRRVATARPDITWVNVDLGYANRDLYNRLLADAPANLKFIAGDIIKMSPELSAYKNKADRIFSYWLIPHLSVSKLEPAQKAISNMWELLSQRGQAIVGPVKHRIFDRKRTTAFTKKDDKLHIVTHAAQETQLRIVPRAVQAFSNKYNVHIGKHLIALLHRSK